MKPVGAPTAWRLTRGVWTRISYPYKATREGGEGIEGQEAIFKAAGYGKSEELSDRVTLYEWIGPGEPDPAPYIVVLDLGYLWHAIYASELPDLLQVLSTVATIDRLGKDQ